MFTLSFPLANLILTVAHMCIRSWASDFFCLPSLSSDTRNDHSGTLCRPYDEKRCLRLQEEVVPSAIYDLILDLSKFALVH